MKFSTSFIPKDGFVELYIPVPEELLSHSGDAFDAAMDQWVSENVDPQGMAIVGCMAVRVDLNEQDQMCKMNKGVRTLRCIRVTMQRRDAVVVHELQGKELVGV